MMKRIITMIVIHCSSVRPHQESSAETIDKWHRERHFACIGYHYVIRRDGCVELGRPIEQMGAHCQNHNRHSIGICYEGGLTADGTPADTRTEEQKVSLRRLLEELKKDYPKALILGHHDLNPMKVCPCFSVTDEYADLQP